MAFIESHQTLARHPKTKAAARLLGVSRPAVVGHLHYLWWWALDHAEDGDLSGLTAEDIAEEALWDGDAQHFVDGLVEAGFLDTNLRIHDWEQHAGRLVAKRRHVDQFASARRALRNDVIARDGYVCGLCGSPVNPSDVDLDHIIPASKGGPTTLDNLRVTHSRCNRARGNRS